MGNQCRGLPDSSIVPIVISCCGWAPDSNGCCLLRAPLLGRRCRAAFRVCPASWRGLLSVLNGFFAFESALHVLPASPAPSGVMTVQLWNDADLWRSGYGSMADGLFFFAEDVFGVQFALASNGVVTFDPETGDVAEVASTLEGWADQLLQGYEMLTGFSSAHAWQQRYGQLAVSTRLLPKRPFVLGGDFTIDNLYDLDAVEGMEAAS